MKDKKRSVYRVGSQIYYANILLATLHEAIDLTVANIKDLRRFDRLLDRQKKSRAAARLNNSANGALPKYSLH
jgi:hypothetical protein